MPNILTLILKHGHYNQERVIQKRLLTHNPYFSAKTGTNLLACFIQPIEKTCRVLHDTVDASLHHCVIAPLSSPKIKLCTSLKNDLCDVFL